MTTAIISTFTQQQQNTSPSSLSSSAQIPFFQMLVCDPSLSNSLHTTKSSRKPSQTRSRSSSTQRNQPQTSIQPQTTPLIPPLGIRVPQIARKENGQLELFRSEPNADLSSMFPNKSTKISTNLGQLRQMAVKDTDDIRLLRTMNEAQ
ncbi:unnamed protein product [Didymodactylos carnosus]|uniref:Uncharacterized protein n=1 Tax=Didymodactylos carnosus TaxID=1234261 RepID=A0A813VJH0_9BILA|nr:unnamed protein product [Didymodactylos carnosus]CAF3634244.1 unnamed protein product [Didymodactylos carnosus]